MAFRTFFVRDLKTGNTTLISINQAGTDSGNSLSYGPQLSADGQLVAFLSGATDLVTTFTYGFGDVFIRDLSKGTTTLASVNPSGSTSGARSSDRPILSADGNFVGFQSDSPILVPIDTNNDTDVFVRPTR
jgi:hypothetical protein